MGQGCSSCFDGLVAAIPGQRPVLYPAPEPTPVVTAARTAPAPAAPGAKLAAALAEAPQEDVLPVTNGYTACTGQAVAEVETTVATVQEVPCEPPQVVEGTFAKLHTKPAMMEDVSSETDGSVELETPSGTATTAELGPDGLPSIGSIGHATGDCKRCCFHPKGRCQNGHECRFCHFDHDKRRRAGVKKKGSRQLSPDSSMTGSGDGTSPVLTPAMGQQPMALILGPQAPCQQMQCIPGALPPVVNMNPYDVQPPHVEAPPMTMGCMDDQAGFAPSMMPSDYGNMPMWQSEHVPFPPLSTAPQGQGFHPGWGPPNFYAGHQPHQIPPPMPFQPNCPPPMGPTFNAGPPLMLPNYTTSAGRPLPELLGVPPFSAAPPPLSSLPPPLGPPPPMSTVPVASLPTAPAPVPAATQVPPAEPAPAPETKKDSPRSVILKLTGAWGALANGKNGPNDAGAFGIEACAPDVLSRQNLLDPQGPGMAAMPAMCVPPAR